MKKKLLPVSFIALFSFIIWTASGQEVHPASGQPLKYCGNTEATIDLYKQRPDLKAAAEIIENQQKAQEETISEALPPVYKIPVVVHILHNYGPENVPDANVHDAIRILNEDFRKLNADISQVQPAFQGVTGDAEIEFELAKLDPNGNCTNGIDRIVTPRTYKAGDGPSYQPGSNASKINMWPRGKYLNIYVVNSIYITNAAGYTYLPPTVAFDPAIDGIIIQYTYFGSLSPGNLGTARALCHEVGHWFNLNHTWTSTNSAINTTCGDDGVSDTPVTKGWLSCNLTSNDVCTNGIEENVQNIMEYAYCQKMFTVGQCTRMRNCLQSSQAQRSSLWTTSNLAATGLSSPATLCKAEFTVNKKIICAGSSVIFTDQSTSLTPTSWQWDFDNNGTTDATTQNPTHTFTTPGTYAVKLTVTNGSTTRTITKSSLIVVLGSTPTATVPYSESFESASFPYNDMYITSNSASSTTWNRATTAGFTGSSSLKLDNHSPTAGDVDEFITPSIDMSNVTSPTMTFRVAYQRRTASDTLDELRIQVSDNCGISWIQKYFKDLSSLPTVTSVSSSAFTPTSSQWREETINISSYAGSPGLRFKFTFKSHGVGNNLYVDDINVNGVLSVEQEFADGFGLNIFPNPYSESTTISFNLQDKYKVAIGVYDIIGKEIISVSNSIELAPGAYSLPMNKNNLKAGIYFVKLDVNGYIVTKKVIVQ